MSKFAVSNTAKEKFGFEGTVAATKRASTIDWAASESDEEEEEPEPKDDEEEEEESDDESSVDDDEPKSSDAVSPPLTEDKPKAKIVPVSKKEKKQQRDNEMKELELALSEFGVNPVAAAPPPVTVSTPGKDTESSAKIDNKKKKKKKASSNGVGEHRDETIKDPEPPSASSASEIVDAVLIDPKEILLQRTRKVKKATGSVAERLAAAELKQATEADKKKKKSKDKSKLGYSEISY